MLSLSPAKLLVILVIALIVLGPEKLPQMARQIGAAWHDLRGWRSRIESEVRGTFPNLPPTHEVAQAVRSPLAFLDRLADQPVTYTDAMSFAVMKALRFTIALTFDRHFAMAGFTMWGE